MTANPTPDNTPAPPPFADADDFPGDDALCEACGYPIKHLQRDGNCPECGSAILDSHPDKRTGLAFHHRPGPVGYLQTASAIIRHPKRTFRAMRIDGRRQPCRFYLYISAYVSMTLWAVFYCELYRHLHQLPNLFSSKHTLYRDWLLDTFIGMMIVFFAIILMTYIEVLGVAWFSRRRGWRVPLRTAERVACYASIGWLPGAVALGITMNLVRNNILQDLYRTSIGNVMNSATSSQATDAVWVVTFLVGVLAMVGFESLVWVGVRQVKFANAPSDRPAPPADHTAPSTATAASHAGDSS